jgi:thioredoxin-like negative regulator of GroEL
MEVQKAYAPRKRTVPGSEQAVDEDDRPRLFFFYGRTSGLSRRVEAYLAQVLQRHRNHSTFRLIRVAVEDHQDLAERFEITELPTLVVVDGTAAQARLEAPRDRASIEAALSPWLL